MDIPHRPAASAFGTLIIFPAELVEGKTPPAVELDAAFAGIAADFPEFISLIVEVLDLVALAQMNIVPDLDWDSKPDASQLAALFRAAAELST